MAVIGKIIKAHGVRGELKVYPYSDFPERVRSLTRVFLESEGTEKAYRVLHAFVHGRYWVLSLEGVTNPDEAALLRDTLVKIPLAERVPLPAGTYYLDELIGMEVFTDKGLFLGHLSEVLQTGSNDVYVVDNEEAGKGSRQVLIPALKSVVVSLDPVRKRMEVVPPDGLL
jgi:16S rRNA processing protein RimM